MQNWIKIAFEKEIVKTSIQVALVVGTILILINYADKIFNNSLTSIDFIKMAITYTVPYLVSTYSCVKTKLLKIIKIIEFNASCLGKSVHCLIV